MTIEETHQNWQSSRFDDPNLISVKKKKKLEKSFLLTAKETLEGIRTIEGIFLAPLCFIHYFLVKKYDGTFYYLTNGKPYILPRTYSLAPLPKNQSWVLKVQTFLITPIQCKVGYVLLPLNSFNEQKLCFGN